MIVSAGARGLKFDIDGLGGRESRHSLWEGSMDSRNLGGKGTSPLLDLQQQGQSVWCDSISRSLLDSGELRRMIEELVEQYGGG